MDIFYSNQKDELLRVINYMHTDDNRQIDRRQIREMIVNDECYLAVLEQLNHLEQLNLITIFSFDQNNECYILYEDYDIVCAKINEIYSSKRINLVKGLLEIGSKATSLKML